MIGKEDVVSWFQKLESYRRIDMMCTLLATCLPFELRFLGTCLEELGRRDAQELRSIELSVNNPQDFSVHIATCQSGEPTNKKVRRSMALYLAMIRAYINRTCVNDLFKLLETWGERDFHGFGDGDALQELLLVYTLAKNHPVFSCEQRLKCDEIFTKIISSDPTAIQTGASQLSPQQSQSQQQPSPVAASSSMQNLIQQQQPMQTSSSLLSHLQTAQQIQTLAPNLQLTTPAMQLAYPGSIPQYNSLGMIDNLAPQMTSIDGMQLPLPTTIIQDFNQMHQTGSLPWIRTNYAAYSIDSSFPPQTSSPMLSQPSSPSNSRTGSPTRVSTLHQQPQQQTGHRNSQPRSIRTSRRPSTETTPPPQHQHQLVGMGSSGEMILQQQPQNMKFDEMLNVDGAMTQLQQLQLQRNGYTRSANHTLPRQTNKQSYSQHMQHYQHQQHQQQQINNFNSGGTTQSTAYGMQQNVVDMAGNVTGTTQNSQKSGGSDSSHSSGSTGDISPPETPVSMATTTPLALRARLNFREQTARTPNLDNKSLSGTSVIYVPPQSTSPHQPQMQQSSNDIPQMMSVIAPITSNLSYSLTNPLLNTSNHMQSPSHAGLLTTNQQIMIGQQQLPPNSQQYAYHTQPQPQQLQNTVNTTRPPPSANYRQQQQHQNVSVTSPYTQLQPNGELQQPQLIYTYPPHMTGNTIAFLPSNPPPSLPPTVLRASPSNTAQQSLQSQLPAGLMAPPPQTTTTPLTIVYSMLPTINKLSCFNCGSTQHNGTVCPEASMEDATRAVYSLDYNTSSAAHLQQPSQQPTPSSTTSATIEQQLPPPPPPTITKTKSSLSLKSSGSENKLAPIIIDEIDLTNLSSSNSSSTNSLNNMGSSHK